MSLSEVRENNMCANRDWFGFSSPFDSARLQSQTFAASSNLFIVIPAKETPQASKETSETSDDNGKETGPDSSAEDWDKKFLESFQKLRNTLTKKLTQLALKPPGEVFMVDSFQVTQCS